MSSNGILWCFLCVTVWHGLYLTTFNSGVFRQVALISLKFNMCVVLKLKQLALDFLKCCSCLYQDYKQLYIVCFIVSLSSFTQHSTAMCYITNFDFNSVMICVIDGREATTNFIGLTDWLLGLLYLFLFVNFDFQLIIQGQTAT